MTLYQRKNVIMRNSVIHVENSRKTNTHIENKEIQEKTVEVTSPRNREVSEFKMKETKTWRNEERTKTKKLGYLDDKRKRWRSKERGMNMRKVWVMFVAFAFMNHIHSYVLKDISKDQRRGDYKKGKC